MTPPGSPASEPPAGPPDRGPASASDPADPADPAGSGDPASAAGSGGSTDPGDVAGAEPAPLALDLGDFDAVGVMSGVVLAVRSHAIEVGRDAVAFVSAPDGWHRVAVTGRRSGHLVVGVRYTELTPSRRHNVARALARRDWQLDDDGEGATVRFPPGTDPSAPAFEVLAVLTLAGAPSDVRQVRAVDAEGRPLGLR